MPKSKNRKNHKKKVRSRNIRMRNEQRMRLNKFKKEQDAKIEEMKAQFEKETQGKSEGLIEKTKVDQPESILITE